jgi:hypothetical protein
MSAGSHQLRDERSGRWPALERLLARLPSSLRPLDSETQEPDKARRRRRRAEMVLLLLVAAAIALASVYDLTREVKFDDRLTADIETWRHVTGIPDEEIAVEQDLASYSTVDTACGSLKPDKNAVSVRVCVMLKGPVMNNRRDAVGGFYLPPYLPLGPNDRYGCFGSTTSEHFCTWAIPPGLPSGVPRGFRG